MHASTAQPDLVSKADFARLKGVSKARVSQWVSQGKIGRDALVGAGPHARINVAVADAHLNRRLDISQRLGNGLATRIGARSPQLAAVPAAEPATAQVDGAATIDPIEERIKREKLEGLQRDNRRKAEEEAARSGRYTSTDDAKQQMGRIASQMLNTFDGWLGEVAPSISAKFTLPQRDVLHLLRSEFRAFRARSSEVLRQQVKDIPELVENDLPGMDSSGDDPEI